MFGQMGDTTTERITASGTQELSRRNRRRVQASPTYLAHIYRVGLIESSLSVLSQASQRVKFFASQVLCTWLAVSQGKCSSRLARILGVLRGLFDWRHERFLGPLFPCIASALRPASQLSQYSLHLAGLIISGRFL